MPATVYTSNLLTNIRNSLSLEDALSYHRDHPDPTFTETLKSIIEKKNMAITDVIRLSKIERSYFYHILDGKKKPGRNMVLRIALCMNCKYDDVNQLLRLSKHATLYPKILRDAIIIFAISKNKSMEEVNELLLSKDQEPLYKE